MVFTFYYVHTIYSVQIKWTALPSVGTYKNIDTCYDNKLYALHWNILPRIAVLINIKLLIKPIGNITQIVSHFLLNPVTHFQFGKSWRTIEIAPGFQEDKDRVYKY